MLSSGRKTPCPSCGRTKDGDCRFNDEVILCHSGESGGPNPALRIGEVVNIEGRSWALVKTRAGHSGSSHVFKPHQPKRQKSQKTTRTGRQQEQQAKAEVASIAIERFFDEFDRAWNVMDFHSLSPKELKEGIDAIETAHQTGQQLSDLIQSIWRENHDLRSLYIDRFNACIRNLGYQVDDLRHFRNHYLGEII